MESPAYRYLAAVLETLAADGLGEGSEVVIVHVDTGFGREVAEGAAVAARRLGLLRRSVSFRPARARDVLAQVSAGDVLLSAGSFDDDVAIAQWASEHRWRAVGLVAAGVDELRHAIGDRVEGLCGPCQWFDDGTDDPADGPNSEWFSQCYRDANGTEPPYPANCGLIRCDSTIVGSPVSRSTASTFLAAVARSPRLAQISSAAVLSDLVIAAIITSEISGADCSRNAASTKGTFAVDHAGRSTHYSTMSLHPGAPQWK